MARPKGSKDSKPRDSQRYLGNQNARGKHPGYPKHKDGFPQFWHYYKIKALKGILPTAVLLVAEYSKARRLYEEYIQMYKAGIRYAFRRRLRFREFYRAITRGQCMLVSPYGVRWEMKMGRRWVFVRHDPDPLTGKTDNEPESNGQFKKSEN